MQMEDGGAGLGRADRRVGDLVRRHGEMGDIDGVWIEPVTAQVMMTFPSWPHVLSSLSRMCSARAYIAAPGGASSRRAVVSPGDTPVSIPAWRTEARGVSVLAAPARGKARKGEVERPMYDVNDPRSALNKTAPPARPVSAFGDAEYARFYAETPQEDGRRPHLVYPRAELHHRRHPAHGGRGADPREPDRRVRHPAAGSELANRGVYRHGDQESSAAVRWCSCRQAFHASR